MSAQTFRSKAEAEARLLELSKTSGKISFCTNIMIWWGTVYHCTVSEKSEAIVETTQGWNEMSYSSPSTGEAGTNLGTIEIKTISGTLLYGFFVKHLSEGRG